ncbi:MAG TPA: hypothetical protein VGQ54_03800 [Burkholderiales bacterium]|jgi:hypothetical protein|nr:hypothetical protein [Burkholderiales bacterium]
MLDQLNTIAPAFQSTPKHETPTPTVTGRNLAHSKRNATERALLAADLVAGER